jgi:hypothetical protein
MRCNPIREPGCGYGLVVACVAAGVALALALGPVLAATGPRARAAGGKGRGAPAGRLLAEALRADYLAATPGGASPCDGPARLYRRSAQGGLAVVVKIVPVPPSDPAGLTAGVDNVLGDGEGDLYVLWPAVSPKFITALRADRPADPLTYAHGPAVHGVGFFLEEFPMAGSAAYGGSLLYGIRPARARGLLAYLARPEPGGAAVRRAPWSDFLDLHVGGTMGGNAVRTAARSRARASARR